jgi:hypothetical protein
VLTELHHDPAEAATSETKDGVTYLVTEHDENELKEHLNNSLKMGGAGFEPAAPSV